MSMDEIITEVLRLPRESRALLAEKLLETLDFDEDFEVDAQWREEIRRRCTELDRGAVSLIPGEQVLDEARQLLG
jgi:putative addiction module component (TIGR02574 family)